MDKKNGYAISILNYKINELKKYQEKIVKKYGYENVNSAYQIREKQIEELKKSISILEDYE